MRKLASIRRIADIRPIEGADAIEVATVDGWNVVVKKGEFTVGDLCIYFEIDSVLPVCDEFEFLRKSSYVKKDWLVSSTNPQGEGFRLKTIKLRGQISQGLVVPLVSFRFMGENFKGVITPNALRALAIGDDVTDILGVVKWDPPVPATLAGRVRGNFPSFIPKTDQERIQNLDPRELAARADHLFEVSIKLDGSSMTVYHRDGRVGVCSRNLELDWEKDPDTTFAKVFIDSGLKDILPALGNYAIQGELMGPGIQGNRENLRNHQFFVYDIYDIDRGCYLNSVERGDFMLNMPYSTYIDHVPVFAPFTRGCDITLESALEQAEGPSITHPIREGIVFKSITDPAFSFKVISNQYLLKEG